MPAATTSPTLRTIDALSDVAAAQWDACAGTDNPFVSHAFLSALEDSGSAVAKTGWRPNHLLAEDADGQLLACAPLYAKSHSYGEYVFDWSWADAWQQAGGRYYPKLQCCVPFTPATGPRLLVRPGLDRGQLQRRLTQAIAAMAQRSGLSSAHITFPTEDEALEAAASGWLLRMGEQYHWHNPGYGSFDDFLAALSSRKRKAIRKERERAQSQGLKLRTLTGDDIRPAHWDAFYRFYLSTVEKKWAHAYLTRDFFDRLGAMMAERVVLMMAEQDGQWVAGALNMIGGDTLYGRNWGAEGEFPFLHFELCYYRAMDFAIEHKLARVEAGAQGEHKVARGYLPTPTWSAHWINDPGFRHAIAEFLQREQVAVGHSMEELRAASPYRQD